MHRALLTIAIVPILASCSAGELPGRAWAGTIDTLANGAVVVSNSQSGVWAGSPPRLVEVLRIGSAAGDGPDAFGQIEAVGIAPDGLLHVADGQASQIRVFTRDGRYVRTIGRPGGGPGEVGAVSGFSWDDQGRLWVVDVGNARYSVFDADGEYLESHQRNLPAVFPWVGGFGAGGRLYDVTIRDGEGDSTEFVYYAFDRSLAQVDAFPPLAYQRPSGPVPSLELLRFRPRTTFALDPAGFIWSWMTGEYRLTKRALAGDTVLVVDLARPQARMSGATRDSLIEAVRETGISPEFFDRSAIPERLPLFERIVVDGQGRPVVLGIAEDGSQVLDFFDDDGRYLGTARLPTDLAAVRPPVVRGDTIVGITTDELGAEHVVELRLERDGS